MVMYDNEFEKRKIIYTKDKIEPQYNFLSM